MKKSTQIVTFLLAITFCVGAVGASFHKVICVRSNETSFEVGHHDCDHEDSDGEASFNYRCCLVNQYNLLLEDFVIPKPQIELNEYSPAAFISVSIAHFIIPQQIIGYQFIDLPPPGYKVLFRILYQSFLC